MDLLAGFAGCLVDRQAGRNSCNWAAARRDCNSSWHAHGSINTNLHHHMLGHQHSDLQIRDLNLVNPIRIGNMPRKMQLACAHSNDTTSGIRSHPPFVPAERGESNVPPKSLSLTCSIWTVQGQIPKRGCSSPAGRNSASQLLGSEVRRSQPSGVAQRAGESHSRAGAAPAAQASHAGCAELSTFAYGSVAAKDGAGRNRQRV